MSDTCMGLAHRSWDTFLSRGQTDPCAHGMSDEGRAGANHSTALHRACFLAVQGLQMSDKKQDLAQSLLPPEMPFTCITC